MLEGALALLLEGVGNDVVQFHAGAGHPAGPYDAAIVTPDVVPGLSADVVIALPGTAGGGHMAHVITGAVDREVPVRSPRDVIELLDAELAMALAARTAHPGP